MEPSLKEALIDYIENELKAIEENETLNSDILRGMRAAYLSIKNIFLELGER